jgi:hypothetical protein
MDDRPRDDVPPGYQDMLRTVIERGRDVWGADLTPPDVAATVDAAYRLMDLQYTIDEAIKWGEEVFAEGIPPATVDRHEQELRDVGGDFDALVAARLAALRPARLNHDRVARLSQDNPERDKMLDLADGIEVVTPPGHYTNGGLPEQRPPLRKLYQRAHKAVDRLFYDLVEAGLAILLWAPTAFAIPGLHLSPAHWAPKAGKRHGRPLIDSTDASSKFPLTRLNGDSVAEWADQYYGPVRHPTIVDIVLMIWAFHTAHPELTWDEIALIKIDLKGAFTLMSYKPPFCKLFGVELVGGIVIVFLCGLFGWSATPAAFQVITRALLHEFNQRLFHRKRDGEAVSYVDDSIFVTRTAAVSATVHGATDLIEDLLGQGSVAHEKTDTTERLGAERCIEAIGYSLDMAHQRATLTRKNLLKTTYAFFSVDTTRRVPLAAVQRMASLASRYSEIFQELKPFSRALYFCTRGYSQPRALIPLTDEARLSIELWRTMLCLAAVHPLVFSRPFHTFVPQQATFVAQFDASLQGIGVLIFQRDPATGSELLVGGSAVPLQGLVVLDEQDSSRQNVAEYMAVIVCLIAILRLRGTETKTGIILRGDSVTALTWAEKGVVRSGIATRACVVSTLLTIRHGLYVAGTEHWEAALNHVCDELSRRDEHGQYRTVERVIPGARDLRLAEDDMVREALVLCEPGGEGLKAEEFGQFWSQISRTVSRGWCPPNPTTEG